VQEFEFFVASLVFVVFHDKTCLSLVYMSNHDYGACLP
jgi:hypothetical protein